MPLPALTRGIATRLWSWPDGLVWRSTNGLTVRSRRARFDLFMRTMTPGPTSKVLDVGVGGKRGRATDFLEELYPWRAKITAVGHGEPEEFEEFRQAYPEVDLVYADGRDLPFSDDEFEIVFSNAVIEHVGSREQQSRFLLECMRVGRRLFLTTPDRWFPIDSHTLIPCAHWLPEGVRCSLYRRAGRTYWASRDHLNLLSASDIRRMLGRDANVEIRRQRMLGVSANLIVLSSGSRADGTRSRPMRMPSS